jgi:MurNAc alpha-1-phosphate uridylyltransferase
VPWCRVVRSGVGEHGGVAPGSEDKRDREDRGIAGVVLAAGAGTRLRPLTDERPMALCPVLCRPLVDHALERVGPWSRDVAVNLHHGADALDAHLPAEVHRSREVPEALGTAGALGALRSWIDGRPVLLTNADAWFQPDLDLSAFVDTWDGVRTRLLCIDVGRRADFGDLRYCGVALLPSAAVSTFEARPSGLYEVSWAAEERAGRLDLVVHDGPVVDCGTPADYLRANLLASGGVPVIDPSATVGDGAVMERCVVWSGARVAAGEHLVDAVRTPRGTVLIRRSAGGAWSAASTIA